MEISRGVGLLSVLAPVFVLPCLFGLLCSQMRAQNQIVVSLPKDEKSKELVDPNDQHSKC